MAFNRRNEQEYVEFEGQVLAETELAYKVWDGLRLEPGLNGKMNPVGVWVPKSALRDVHVRGNWITCEMSEWMARKKGLV